MKKLLLAMLILASVAVNAQVFVRHEVDDQEMSSVNSYYEPLFSENKETHSRIGGDNPGGTGGGAPIEDGLFVLAGLAGIYLLVVRRKAV